MKREVLNTVFIGAAANNLVVFGVLVYGAMVQTDGQPYLEMPRNSVVAYELPSASSLTSSVILATIE